MLNQNIKSYENVNEETQYDDKYYQKPLEKEDAQISDTESDAYIELIKALENIIIQSRHF